MSLPEKGRMKTEIRPEAPLKKRSRSTLRADEPPVEIAAASERGVRAVTERLVAGLLAAAKIHGIGSLGSENDRCQPCAFVGPVAIWLRRAAAATAPSVLLPCLDLDRKGAFLSDHGLFHGRAFLYGLEHDDPANLKWIVINWKHRVFPIDPTVL